MRFWVTSVVHIHCIRPNHLNYVWIRKFEQQALRIKAIQFYNQPNNTLAI